MLKLIETTLENDIVEYFSNFKTPPPISNNSINTFKGNQTPNIVKDIDPHVLNNLKFNYILPFIKELQGSYDITDLKIYHLHHIKYNSQGKQKIHDHSYHEDYSFIIYLNNCTDGQTIFYTYPKPLTIFPKKGNMVLFKANIPHEGLETNSFKQVIVGGIREIGKTWR